MLRFILQGRCCQPSFDVEQRPFARHMLPDCLEQEIVRDIVEQAFAPLSDASFTSIK